jgi:hypothetical protein
MNKALIAAVVLAVAAVVLYPPPKRPSIRINSVDRSYAGEFVLRYSVNGAAFHEIFTSEADMRRYQDYLAEVGRIVE